MYSCIAASLLGCVTLLQRHNGDHSTAGAFRYSWVGLVLPKEVQCLLYYAEPALFSVCELVPCIFAGNDIRYDALPKVTPDHTIAIAMFLPDRDA